MSDLKQLIEQLIEENDFENARVLGNDLQRNSPPDPDVYALLGYIEINLGNVSVGRRYLLEALRLAPDSEIAKENLAYLDRLELDLADSNYIHQWFLLRGQHMHYPRLIHLETSGRCNAKCNFCPHPGLDRKFDEMSDTLFEKIVNEASTFPCDNFHGFVMHAVNEPFMDRKIFDRLAFINEKVPNAQIGINTNMNVMHKMFFERIRKIRGLSDWNISLNAANKKEYDEVMQLDFDRTISNVRKLLSENRETRFFDGIITLSRVKTHDERDAQFEEQCKEIFPKSTFGDGYKTALLGRANWLGEFPQALPRFMHFYPCHQWTSLTIHCDGKVPHCCVDAKAQFPFGDLNSQTILEVYNGPYWQHLRQTVPRRDFVFPCGTCDLS